MPYFYLCLISEPKGREGYPSYLGLLTVLTPSYLGLLTVLTPSYLGLLTVLTPSYLGLMSCSDHVVGYAALAIFDSRF